MYLTLLGGTMETVYVAMALHVFPLPPDFLPQAYSPGRVCSVKMQGSGEWELLCIC